uniref:Integrase catalytic domain-containing protein n=1 Tax=Haemonchus contortus TaxID=6289 RepID=A0A7I4Y3E6_HAECO
MFQSNVVTLKILTAHGMEINMKAQTKPIITNGFSSVHLSMEDKHFLQLNELWVCNPRVQGEHQNPHILVGLDYYYHLVPPNSKFLQLPSGLHIAKTIFGPSIHGRGIMPMQTNRSGTHERCSPLSTDPESKQLMQQLTAISEPTEAEMLNKLFELQGLGINPHELTREDTTFSYFQEYSKRIQINNGTVTAPLPLKENVTDLSDNYAVAYRRLISLWKHMQNNKEQQKWYTKTFEEYISTNVVEHADEVNTNSVGCYYMPHSGVWRPAKPKPLRIVFDASSKKCGQLSLNDAAHTGESFVNKIHDILVASRTGKIILLCDIQAAFTQIRLQEEHKDLCRFLWFKKANDPPTRDNIVEYRFTRLPFDLTASPSILNMVILAYLNHKDTDIAREIMDYLYVDNILLRANTTEEALQKYKDSKAIFAEIGMNLREYISNSSEVNAAIPEQDRLQGTKIKFLGVEFNTETDEFQVSTTMAQKDYLTKRDIVSQLSSIYDPIGVVGPLLVKLKSLMRQIYDTTLKWNDRVPAELCHKWQTACREINDVTIKMPRRAANDTDKRYTLWVFCDASKLAIAACAYLQNNDTHAVSQLISGKTRLTPKKTVQTIPKLELLAILIGITLAKTLQSKLRLKIPSISIVSDSEIALAWIKSTRKLPPFVTNQRKRIYQIKQQIEDAKETVVNFYYVPTNYNPADAGTRGLTSHTIKNHDWVRGPRWLETGPNITLLKSVENITEYVDSSDWEEPDQPKMTISHPVVSIPNDKLIDTTRYSRYTRLLRTLAVVCKTLSNWVHRCNQKRSTSIATANLTNFSKEMEICSDDIMSAEKMLLASEHRSVSIEELQRRFPHINIVRDENEVIRYESRIRNANLPYDTRSPIYIPNDSDLARLIITKIHNENAHCGKDHVLSLARQNYWIPQPSRAIKKYLKGCVICKRCHGLPFGAPEMPPLPKDRVVITKPFQNVGCDFMGPFDSKEKTKMYVCLYTCLTTRAVHLEVVENMTAVAFLNSFVRFASRRGVPKLIRTDCGTNFKVGQVVINNLYQNNDIDGYSVMSYSSSEGIKWIFNPPSAPWMGGVWERLVGTVKRCFSKAIGRKKLTFIEMTTAITRIEAIINTRPLTKVSLTDLNEIPLRPVDFLQGNLKFALPQASQISDHSDSEYDPELIQTVSQAKQAIAHSETIAAKFWEKWNTEYLTAIRDSHTKNLKQPRHISSKYPQLGEIVIVEQEYLPRGNWYYGKIIELIKSADGMIRSVKVRMPNQTVLHRPLNKLYPLEIRSNDEEIEESSGERSAVQSRLQENNTNERTSSVAEPLHSLQASRRNQERTSKTRAYEVMRNYERQLHSSSPTSINCSTWTLLTILLCAMSTGSANNSLMCADGSAIVDIQKTSFELCFNQECRTFINLSKKLVLKIPASPLHKLATVTTRVLRNNYTETVECPPIAFCEHASQMMTSSLIGNPHCWPMGAIASIAIMLYALGVIILISVKTVNHIVTRRGSTTPAQEIVVMNTFNPRPLNVSTTVTTMLVILAMLNSLQACQHGHMRHSVNMVCNNQGNCSYEYNDEVLFNHIQSELCISARYGNKTIGVIKIRQKPLKLVCSKVLQFFTRETRHEIFYTTRCAEAGSCTENRCNTLKPHENIEELQEAGQYPGYSACEHTCGGPLCGCFLPLEACSFIRVVQIPTSESVFEIVNCVEWVPIVEFEVEFKVHKLEQNRKFTLIPYITQSYDEISLTAISIQKPSSPLFDQRFAISEKEAFIVPNNFELPVQCPTANMATKSFVNCSNQMMCNCKSYKTPRTCHCSKHSIKDIRAEVENKLPITTPSVEFGLKNKQINAHSTMSEITLAIRSSLLINSAEFIVEQKCSVELSTVTGCYNCQEGAEVTAFCTTALESVVTIQCENLAFAANCDPFNKTTRIALELNKSLIAQKCFAICDKKEIPLELNGRLHYHVRYFPPTMLDEDNVKATTWPSFNDFHFPDLEPIARIVKGNWKITVTALAVITGALGITYMLGPLVITTILKVVHATIMIVVNIANNTKNRIAQWSQRIQ